MRDALLEQLASKRTFTIQDSQQISTVNKAVLKVILSRLELKRSRQFLKKNTTKS
jgi:predicted transcriptional regulator of viral defense system